MNSIRRCSLVKSLTLVLLAVGSCPTPTKAQASVEGRVTLAFDARWGTAFLTPGEYSFSILSTGLPALVSVRRRSGRAPVAILMARGWDGGGSSEPSVLTLTRTRQNLTITSLHLVELGLTFYYSGAQPKNELLGRGPKLTQRVPVSGSAK